MNFTAQFTKIDSGYMGQIAEWPQVVTEGDSLEDCRLQLKDAIRQMILAHKQLGIEIPKNKVVFEKISLEPEHVS